VRLWWLLALATMVRLAVAGLAPLSPDEAYYWVWSRSLAAGYFDHPPMVALFVRAGTALIGDSALGVRLLAPLSAALGSVLLARAAEDLLPGRGAGVGAAVLLNATLLLGAGAVTMTPDTPLLLFWTATLAATGRLIATGDGRWWLAAGTAGGLALDSKYSAALLGPALVAWMLLAPKARRWWRSPYPYLAAILAATAFVPVLAWNAAHDWAGLLKQGGRLGDFSVGHAIGYLTELIAGQVGLATPGLAVLFVAGVAASCRRDVGPALLACVTLVPIAVFAQHALGDRVQANWPAIAFPTAAIAAAGLGPWWRRWRTPSVAVGVATTAVVYLQAVTAPLPLPPTLDPTLARLGGWPGLAREVAASVAREHAAYVAIDNYGLASTMARLLPPDIAVVAIEPRWAYFRLPSGTPTLAAGPGLVLRSARRTDIPDPRDWASVTPAEQLTRARGGVAAETYRLYRVTARPGGTASVLLPHLAGADHAPSDP
jgi:4-amino-4-deoxy-L-arabinose transferase-like glycosyltransferase